MSHSLVLLVLEASLAVALPSGGLGGPRSGSSGGYLGESNGELGSRSVYIYHSSGSNEPLSKGAMIALIVIFSIFGVVMLVITVFYVALKLKLRKLKRTAKEAPIPEKQTLTSSDRTSFEEPSSSSYNPGHTQAATNSVSNARMTSGSSAGHSRQGAGDGSRGGGAPVVWDARALATTSHGMSNAPHYDPPIPENDRTAGH